MNCISIVATPDQQPSTQLFARDEQRLSLGICWRSLSIKPDCQLQSKTGEINNILTHMPLLLTQFHLYWRKHVLQDTHSNTSGKPSKMCNQAKCKADSRNQISKKEKKKAHLHVKLGPSTGVEGAQGHSGTDHTKVLMRRGHQGVSAPQRLPPRPSFHQLMHGGMLRRQRIVS